MTDYFSFVIFHFSFVLIVSTLLQFYFESNHKRGAVVETPETTDWETVFKRQRAIQGVCGKRQPDFSEQWIQQVSYSSEEKVRAFQKTKTNPTDTNRSGEAPANNWLDSPNTTAESRLRYDSEHLKTRDKQKDSGKMIQWKPASQSVVLFEDSLENFDP